jgi:hypothetical protein
LPERVKSASAIEIDFRKAYKKGLGQSSIHFENYIAMSVAAEEKLNIMGNELAGVMLQRADLGKIKIPRSRADPTAPP